MTTFNHSVLITFVRLKLLALQQTLSLCISSQPFVPCYGFLARYVVWKFPTFSKPPKVTAHVKNAV